MAKNMQPIAKRCKALGISPAVMGYAKKETKRNPGGQMKKKKSEYAIQLNEKQKVKFVYGMLEKQFRSYYVLATKMPGVAGENLLQLLESRLDNVVFRLGLSNTRRESRQMVNHGHILVNGKKVDIPSYRVKVGDVISLKENSLNHPAVELALKEVNRRVDFVKYDEKKKEATFVRYPERSELNADINEALIVEFYSRV